mgnify:CR=1 FL=1
MKKRYLLLALIPFLVACGGKKNKDGKVEPIAVPEETAKTYEDVVYVGFLTSKAYDPDKTISFNVTVDDESIVTYTNKTINSNSKSGTTIIHFVSPMVTYNVTVTVQDDYTVPHFTLDDSKVIINTNKDFNVVASLTYRGLEAISYSDGLHITNETNTGASTLTVEGNILKVHGNKAGKDTYTVYTTAFEHTLSKPLTVEVKDDNSIVIAGERLEYTNNGPIYNVSMYQYDSKPINLRNDLSFTKNGTTLDYSLVTITSKDTSIVSIVGDTLTPHKSGKTALVVSCDGISTDVEVFVYKPNIDTKEVTVADNKFSLDFNVNVNKTNKQRTYEHILNNKKTFALPTETYSFDKVKEVT